MKLVNLYVKLPVIPILLRSEVELKFLPLDSVDVVVVSAKTNTFTTGNT